MIIPYREDKKQNITISNVMIIIVCIIIMVVMVSCDSADDASKYTYEIVDEQVIITGVTAPNETSFNIPKKIEGYPVTSIKSFDGLLTVEIPGRLIPKNHLKAVVIPDSVTSINANIFNNSPNLTIYGKSGSYAEEYATKYNIPFVAQ